MKIVKNMQIADRSVVWWLLAFLVMQIVRESAKWWCSDCSGQWMCSHNVDICISVCCRVMYHIK